MSDTMEPIEFPCFPVDYFNHPDFCQCEHCKEDREAMRGDYLRDEMIDREMEERRDHE